MTDLFFPWSDNWWIDGDKAWFCGGEIVALFCVDLKKKQCELVARIPESNIIDFRVYSYCIKYKNIIFCMPSMGNCIWCYATQEKKWGKIEIGNKYPLSICMLSYKKNSSRVYLQDKAGQMFELNLEKKEIKKIYQHEKKSDEIGKYVLVDSKLYHAMDNRIYCTNINNTIDTIRYEISDIKGEIFTICYDGFNFWLSGHSKEIFIWNPQGGIVQVITDFPKEFGFYHFRVGEIPYLDCVSSFNTEASFFEDSIVLGKYIWFIPCRSDDIIYVDKETYEVFLLEIEEERETKESIEKHLMDFKYLIEYVREDRYIGLYSCKRRLMFEIDAVELCVKNRNYYLNNESFLSITKEIVDYDSRKIFRENRAIERKLYSALLKEKGKKEESTFHNIGNSIYYTF